MTHPTTEVASTAVSESVRGQLGWAADDSADFFNTVPPLLDKGAVLVNIQTESDRTIIHYVIELDRAKAQEVLGYVPDEDEWLEQ